MYTSVLSAIMGPPLSWIQNILFDFFAL